MDVQPAGTNIASTRTADVAVVRITGEVDMGVYGRTREAVFDAFDGSAAGLVVDLTEVTFFGSAGISILVEAARYAEERGLGFAVATDVRAVVRPLTATGLDGVLRLRPDVTQATDAVRTATTRL
ncbi:STAS domain-containing protein [Actinosynnema sp. NPDC020468]|uniref:STAS domain-containing protein n=1 Tax=Actinosynnema sp. NPDC020468 TaxID=3154488 RepID=UPI0033ED774A